MELASLDTRRPKGKLISPRETVIDASKMPETTNESGGDDGLQFPTGIQFDVGEHTHNMKACDAGADYVHKCKSNIETAEGFAFSAPELVGMHKKSSVSADVKLTSKARQYGSRCHDGSFNKESLKSPTARNQGHKLSIDVVSNSDTNLFSSGQPRISHSSTKVGFLSSNANSSKENPSFEFFVVSEEGIDLYVDLNSIPSEWITSLKDEVCIDQISHHQSLGSPSKPAKCFSDSGQHVKAFPYESSEQKLQSNGVEINTGCTNSSLSSVVGENCHSEVDPVDATMASSELFIVTASGNPAEISDEILCVGVTANLQTRDCHSLKFRDTAYGNVEVKTESNNSKVCEKNNLTELNESLDNSKVTDIGIVENEISVEHIKLERSSRCGNMEGSCHLENSVPEDPDSRQKNSRKSNLLKGEQKCLQFQNSLENLSKRSRSEFNEENQNKRHASVGDNENGTSLCTKSSVNENVNDLTGLRRRSSRLLSKVY